MAQQILVNVDDPADVLAGYGVGALVRLERASSSAFADAVEVGTIPVVDGQTQYAYWDAGGAADSWYRSRYSAAGGSPYSSYSEPFQPGAPSSFASLDSLLEYLRLPNSDQDNLLVDLLRQATDYLIGELGRDVFRHPAVAGTEVRILNGEGGYRLDVPAGIVSLTGIRLAAGSGAPWYTMLASDWTLVGGGRPYLGVGGGMYQTPATAIELTDVSVATEWYSGTGTVELTGVFGFPAIPSLIEKATLDLAREWYRQGPGGGGPVGVNQYGTPLFAAGMPLTIKKAIEQFGVGSWVIA